MPIQSPTLLQRKGYTFFPVREGVSEDTHKCPSTLFLLCSVRGLAVATNPSDINNFYKVLKEPWRH